MVLPRLHRERVDVLLDERKALQLYLDSRDDSSEWLFPTEAGTPMSYSRFYQMFRDYATEAGLPEELRHCHALKHFCGSTMCRKGVGIEFRTLAALPGWAAGWILIAPVRQPLSAAPPIGSWLGPSFLAGRYRIGIDHFPVCDVRRARCSWL